ncbi:MAG: trypsin-like peptidase domain-containing protein [Lachnospiraceae bacterium]|nr:trypsin-like peptidase domain-containing protein [Lachnospiraceae bacterium]
MRVVKRLMTLLMCLLFTVSVSACGEKETALTEEELIKMLQKPTVMITVGSSHASGVIVKNDASGVVIATVTHLMTGFDQGIIRFFDGHAGFADVVYSDEATDITLLFIKRSDMDEAFADSLVPAVCDRTAYDAMAVDDTIYVVGSAVSTAANVMKGKFKAFDYYVPEFDQYLLYLYCDVFAGMSGSGVYTDGGVLCGIVAGGSEEGETVAIPLTDILDSLEKVN